MSALSASRESVARARGVAYLSGEGSHPPDSIGQGAGRLFSGSTEGEKEEETGAPNGIRIRAAGLKGRCPRPLDDGGTRVAGGLYLGVRGAPTRLPRGRLRSTADSEGQMTHPTVVGPFAGDGTELPAMYEVRQRFDL